MPKAPPTSVSEQCVRPAGSCAHPSLPVPWGEPHGGSLCSGRPPLPPPPWPHTGFRSHDPCCRLGPHAWFHALALSSQHSILFEQGILHFNFGNVVASPTSWPPGLLAPVLVTLEAGWVCSEVRHILPISLPGVGLGCVFHPRDADFHPRPHQGSGNPGWCPGSVKAPQQGLRADCWAGAVGGAGARG